jgi:hypothetical protein
MPKLQSWRDLAMAKQKQPGEDKPWSTMDVFDLRHAIEQGDSIELIAAVLGRAMEDVRQKVMELNLIPNSDH